MRAWCWCCRPGARRTKRILWHPVGEIKTDLEFVYPLPCKVCLTKEARASLQERDTQFVGLVVGGGSFERRTMAAGGGPGTWRAGR